MFEKALDFLAIGDITTDAFIRLKDANVHCKLDHEDCQLCMRFGDKVPYEFVEEVRAVGNSANAAVSAARLGLSAGLMADIGGDQNGQLCVAELKKNRVSTKYVSTHHENKTNYHYVLWFEDERTILVKHEHFAYKFEAPARLPRWVYLSSLGETALDYQLEIAAWLNENPGIKLAFQPGTFQMSAGLDKLMPLYRRADVFFCNVQEAERILKMPAGSDIKELSRKMNALGPKIVVITDGPKGAYVFDGTKPDELWFMPTYPDPKPPYERTGAGDAFASTFVAALALGKTVPEALSWGPINSMSVVQQIGAQKGLLSRAQIEDFLKKAPPEYVAKKV